MSRSISETRETADVLPRVIQPLCLGQIVEITKRGQILVDFPGNPWGSVEARSIVAHQLEDTPGHEAPVLLWFENGDPALPIIVGWVRDCIEPVVAKAQSPVATQEETAPPRPSRNVTVDGERIVIDGDKEILLRCGESSITLRKDGKILIKGTSLVSHASGANKIKGAHVAIN